MTYIREFWITLISHGRLIALAASLSAILFALAVITLPLVIIAIPADYFTRERDPGAGGLLAITKKRLGRYGHPLLVILVLMVKNLVGLGFFLAGFIMLFIPGQGLLTMFAGLLLVNFPGKRRLELSIVRKKAIRAAIGWIRAKAHKEPLSIP